MTCDPDTVLWSRRSAILAIAVGTAIILAGLGIAQYLSHGLVAVVPALVGGSLVGQGGTHLRVRRDMDKQGQ